jgi:hypothetical protein
MGTYHTFRDLQQYARKDVKYKQGVTIDAAYKNGLIDQQHFEIGKGGMCAAFSMAWLKEKLLDMPSELYHRGHAGGAGTTAKVPPAEDSKNQQTAAKIAGPYKKYKSNYTASGDITTVQGLAQDFGLRVNSNRLRRFEDFYELIRHYEENLKPEDGIYIEYDIWQSVSGHCVALYRDANGCFWFFDPNVGGYQIHASAAGLDKYGKFFETYRNKLMEERFQWYIMACSGFLVGF